MKTTDFLAIYGAALSTSTAIWNYMRSQPKVKVRLVFALEKLEGKPVAGLVISVQNHSAQTVHIANVSLLYPTEHTGAWAKAKFLMRFKRWPRTQGWCYYSLSYLGVEDGCPMAIESGKSHKIFIAFEKVETLLEKAVSRRLIAAVQDAIWRNEYSRTFEFPAK